MNKKFLAIIAITCLLSSSAFFLFPTLELFSDKVAMAMSLAILIPQAVAMWLFITSLKAFRKELRIAYYILAIGVLIFGLVQLQLPLLIFATLDPIVSAWLTVSPALLGAFTIYIGVRKFARLLVIHTIWSNWLFAAALAAIFAFASSLIPHTDIGIGEKLFDGLYATYVAGGAFSLSAAMLALRIRASISATYKAAMGWLAAALFFAAFACFHETVIRVFEYFSQFENYYAYGISLWAFLVSALLFLKASLSFRATSQQRAALSDNASYLDIVDYVAQKVSNPTAIDVDLDKVRQITALRGGSAELTANDKTALINVYLAIEKYLVTKEPLRVFTQDRLREELPTDFIQALSPSKKAARS